jgi:hypothetical protein
MVIVDKCYLDGCSATRIERELARCTVLITYELVYEITTNTLCKNPRDYFDKIANLNLVRTRPLLDLARKEITVQKRVDNIVDDDETTKFIDFVRNGKGEPLTWDVQKQVEDFFEVEQPRRLLDGLARMWDAKFDDLFEKCKAERNKFFETREASEIEFVAGQYKELMGLVGHGMTIAQEHKMTREPEAGWLIHDWERLRNLLAFRYRLNGNRPEQLKANKKLANQLLDLHYLAFLSHADAIATGDTALVIPLAKAYGPTGLKIIPIRAGNSTSTQDGHGDESV